MSTLALAGASTSSGDVLVVAPGFEATNVITGLDRPTNIEFSPDGRIFVTEQGGLLKVFDGPDDTTPTIAADLRDATHSVDGRGLLGLALDPDFPNTPDVYVMYAHDAPIGGTAPTFGVPGSSNDECPNPPGPGECVISGRISKLALSGDVAVSETVILEDWCQEWTSHSVGDLRFASDGSLYATSGEGAFAGQPDWGQRSGINGCGDPPIPHGGENQDAATAEGGALRAQDMRTTGDPAGLSGTVIRIDKTTGDAHSGNPNFGHDDDNVARTVAYGLRNPYRTALHPNGELYIGDVGWNDYEEINLVPPSPTEVLNFGWPCYEGPALGYDIGNNLCTQLVAEGPTAVDFPYWYYEQTVGFVPGGDGCLNNNGSPSALTFYDIGAYPAEYDGAFFFGDYSRRCIWAMLAGPDGRPDPSTVRVIMRDVAVTDLEIGPGGDVYAVNIFGGGGLGGTIIRLSYPEGEVDPVARVTADPTSGSLPLQVDFDASTSVPGAPGDTLSFDWDFDGDGTFGEASGELASHTYTTEGRFTAQVRVTDQNGVSSIASAVILAGDPPVPTITSPSPGLSWIVDDELTFAGSAVDGQGNPIPATDLTWDLILHHCESLTDCHTHNIGTIEDVESGSFLAPTHEYPSFIEINLTATTASGLQATESLELYPDTAFLTLDGDPSGVQAGFNGQAVPTPSIHEVIVGSINTLSADSRQIIGGQAFDFDSWSDGGDQTHDLVVSESRTVTLNYLESTDPIFYLSSTSGGSVGGVAFADEDIIAYNSGTDVWSMIFDGSDVGLGVDDVNGFAIVSLDPLVVDLTIDVGRTIPNFGAVDDSDVFRFSGVGGDDTAGTFERLVDGSDVALTSSGEDIDAIAVSGADLLFSTLGNVSAGNGVSGADEDLLRFSPTSTGTNTVGTWAFEFDGSDVGLEPRDLFGASVDPATGDLFGAATGSWTVGGVAGDKDDVFKFVGTFGPNTSGTAEIVFDGDAHPGFGSEQIDGLHVQIGDGPSIESADLSATIGADVSTAGPGDLVTFTVDVANAGPDEASGVTAPVTLPAGLVLSSTSGCAGDPPGLPCDLGTIGVGGAAQFTVVAQVDGSMGGLLSTAVSVSSTASDPVGGNNADSAEVLVDVPVPPVAIDDGPAPGSSPGDLFHIAQGGQLDVADGGAEDLDGNDDLGQPAGAIVSFGGGDLGGSVTDHPADTSVIVATGTLTVGGDGSFTLVPDSNLVGSFTFDYRVQNEAGFSDATVTVAVGVPEPPSGQFFVFSSTSGGSVGGVGFADEDLVGYDTATDTWSMVFDGSDVGLGPSDVNGFAIVSLEPLVVDLTIDAAQTIPNFGAVDDSDVFRFAGVGGNDTTGTFERLVDGSDVGLTADGEDIDAVTAAGSDWLFSTLGNVGTGSGVAGVDEDLLRFSPTSTGTDTAGTWAVEFDGSDVGLAPRDLFGASIDPATGDLYGAATGTWTVGGVAGDKDDVFRFAGTFGPNTSGTAEIVFDGDAHPGFGSEQIDGLHVLIGDGPVVESADLSATIGADVSTAGSGDLVTFTVDVANAGPDEASNVVASVTLPTGLALNSTSGCAGDPVGLPCDLGTIGVGGAAQFTVVAQVDGSMGGSLSTGVSVASAASDPVGGNNGDSAEVLVDVPVPPVAVDDGPGANSSPGDPFHVAQGGQLVAVDGGAEDLDGNDDLGQPAGAIVSFGGGDLGGSVTDHVAGATAAGPAGTLTVGADGGFTLTPDSGLVGSFTFDYRVENGAGFSDATVTVAVGIPEPPSGELIVLSSTSGGSVGGVSFADEDLIGFNTATDTWSMVFDGSDAGLGPADVDGFAVISLDPLIVDLSFDAPRNIAGLGTIDDSDLVRFTGVGGPNTSGSFEIVFDGSDVGLTADGEDLDAVAMSGSDWLFSTYLNVAVPGAAGADEDLVRFTPATTGTATTGTWTFEFDGSDVGLGPRDLTAAWVSPETGDLYGAATSTWTVGGVAGDKDDVFRFSGTFGSDTSGVGEIVFDGDAHPGFGTEQIDGLSILPSP